MKRSTSQSAIPDNNAAQTTVNASPIELTGEKSCPHAAIQTQARHSSNGGAPAFPKQVHDVENRHMFLAYTMYAESLVFDVVLVYLRL